MIVTFCLIICYYSARVVCHYRSGSFERIFISIAYVMQAMSHRKEDKKCFVPAIFTVGKRIRKVSH